MAEIVTLTTPISKPSQTSVSFRRLELDAAARSVFIRWLGNNGEEGSAFYPTPAPAGSSQPSGQDLIAALNTANLSSNSLVRRVLARLQLDGYIPAGTISGTPD